MNDLLDQQSTPSLRAAALQLQDVTLERGGRAILSDITLAVEPGLVALIGPNGAGKSSLLRVFAGLWAPTRGSAMLDGRQLADWPRLQVARRVSFLPQGARPIYAFTVEEVVGFGRAPHRRSFSRLSPEDRDAVAEALHQTDSSALAQRYVTELSAGELQRVLLARCLATHARILLLDEPAANLDLRHALELLELCRRLADDGRRVIVALHDLQAAATWPDKLWLLDRGTLVATGLPKDVLSEERLRQVFEVERHAAGFRLASGSVG